LNDFEKIDREARQYIERTVVKENKYQNTTKNKYNNILKEKIDNLEHEYRKVRKALEFIIPVISDKMKDGDFREQIVEKRRRQMITNESPKSVMEGKEFRLVT